MDNTLFNSNRQSRKPNPEAETTAEMVFTNPEPQPVNASYLPDAAEDDAHNQSYNSATAAAIYAQQSMANKTGVARNST